MGSRAKREGRPLLLRARAVVQAPDRVLEDAAVLVAEGRVRRVATGAAVRRAARAGARLHDLGEGVLAPGLVDAHAHLELTGLAGSLPRDRGFAAWVGELVRRRAARPPALLAADARRGAARLLATGATSVGDVDSTGAGERAASRGLRTVLFREVLDAWDEGRTAAALARVRRALPRRARRREGLSPHAPFTTSAALLSAARALRDRRGLPVLVHWAETEEEALWLERGEGPLAALVPRSPRRSGLDLLDEAGLLDARLALVHGNHPRRGEPERIAAVGASVVHCPGCHAWFGRAPFPWRLYERAGVRIALGTDSAASNDDLDLRREMALARASAPWLPPERILAMATTEAARAIGLGGEAGSLHPGAAADAVLHRLEAREPRAIVEELASGGGEVLAAWIGGTSIPRGDRVDSPGSARPDGIQGPP